MNLFKTANEEYFVGSAFAKLLDLKYEKMNSFNKLVVDGAINGNLIELQNLKYGKALENRNFIIDTLSVFYFKSEIRSSIFLTDDDLLIKTYGKLFTLPDEAIYLVYIKKADLKKLNLLDQYNQQFKNTLQDDLFFFFPINFKKLKSDLKNFKIKNFVNNKQKNGLSDNWQSAFCYVSMFKENICFSKKELIKLLS